MQRGGGWGSVEQHTQERGRSEGVQNFYLGHFIFTNWQVICEADHEVNDGRYCCQ